MFVGSRCLFFCLASNVVVDGYLVEKNDPVARGFSAITCPVDDLFPYVAVLIYSSRCAKANKVL